MGIWYIVRHGETVWNRNGRIQGHTDVPLGESGRRQVKMLAKRLAGCSFSTVYASDLSRSIESAQVLSEGRDVSIETDSDLREFSYGEWEGLTLAEAEAREPTTFAKQLSLADRSFAAPGGEDATQLLDRVRRFHTRAMNRCNATDNLLIVAHGGPIRALLVCLLGLTDEHFWRFRVDCAGLSIISYHLGGGLIELWNDTGHLSPTV